ncbi:MAG: GH25 family lysozyme [Chloroflexota bacterium]
MRPHRLRLPGVVALLVAMAVLPLAPGAASAGSDYAANCSVNLRASPSTSASVVAVIQAGTVITASETVAGDPWSATCPTAVAGNTWYAVSAVNGTSVSSLYGAGVVYAATGLFQPSSSPPSSSPSPSDSPPPSATPSPSVTPPPGPVLEGIDVSHWQAAIDWSQVAGSGKRFVIMKATQGQSFLDSMYAANHAGARAAGLTVGAYHFATPSSDPNDPILEADWYVANAGLLPGDLVPALDLEQNGGLSPSALQTWVGAWLAEVYARLGVRPMIYTSPSFWKNSMGNTTMFADQGYAILWVAHWFVTSPTVPANNWGGRGWTFWQYDDCGSVAGIAGCVDLDRYNGLDLTPVTFNYAALPPNPPPIVVGIEPASAPAGSGDLTISIQGANFASGVSAAYWSGTAVPTTYVSPTQLTAIVPAALTTTQGMASVTVVNEPPGGGASAPSLFTIGPPAAQLRVTPSATVVAWGQQVSLAIQVEPAGANRVVTLQALPAGGSDWTDLATLTTDPSGQATYSVTPAVNTQFRATYAGGPDLSAGTSPPVRIIVRQLAILRPTSNGALRTVLSGTKVTFTATVRPISPTGIRPKVSFAFWRSVGGRWQYVTKRDVYADGTGRASWTWTFSSRGQWYVRAIANPTPTNANSAWSPLERYSVR